MAIEYYMKIISILLLTTAFLFNLVILVKEKAIASKLICLEIVSNTTIVAVSLLALYRQQPIMMDVCIAIALVMFLSNVAYCQYLIGQTDD